MSLGPCPYTDHYMDTDNWWIIRQGPRRAEEVRMEPLLLTPEQAFELIAIGRSHGFKLIASGELPSIKIGRLRRISRAELEKWVEKQTARHRE